MQVSAHQNISQQRGDLILLEDFCLVTSLITSTGKREFFHELKYSKEQNNIGRYDLQLRGSNQGVTGVAAVTPCIASQITICSTCHQKENIYNLVLYIICYRDMVTLVTWVQHFRNMPAQVISHESQERMCAQISSYFHLRLKSEFYLTAV